ncbi:hypothetical protein Pmani_000179 [Petrolisthes manimaculis]|uniref:RRM domain-containing protein n=1 Tax=Petrolisthes manimaculis TaxID=1843537 RepID=A0AAE1UQJ8_9EUCA|nr:hypothetical protein Pmani_000179 [Petrolisthes manimaculis]
MVEKFGALAEFDFLYHRSGPQAGQPRGYAFITFRSPASARAAMGVLDGRVVLGRRMAVKWAHAQDESLYERSKDKPAPPILSAGKEEKVPVSKQSKIAELEAKLKLMDESSLSVDLAPDVGDEATRPTSVMYHFIERRRPGQGGPSSGSSTGPRPHTAHPYPKSKPPMRKY